MYLTVQIEGKWMWKVNLQVHRSVNILIHGQSFLSAGILLCIPHKQVLR